MQHRVAVGAHGPEVLDRVDSVAAAELREWHQVVDVDESAAEFAVDLLEVETADLACWPVVSDALVARPTIALVAIDEHPDGGPLEIGATGDCFFASVARSPRITPGGLPPQLLKEINGLGGKFAQAANLLLIDLAVGDGEPVAGFRAHESQAASHGIERNLSRGLLRSPDGDDVQWSFVIKIVATECSLGRPPGTHLGNFDPANEEKPMGVSFDVDDPNRIPRPHLAELLARSMVEKVTLSRLLQGHTNLNGLPIRDIVGHQRHSAVSSTA